MWIRQAHRGRPQNLTSLDATMMVGGYLDPQWVTSAGRAICNSGQDIHCGLSVVSADRAPETIAGTDDVPARVDWLQHKLGQGPSVGPDRGEVLVIEDLGVDKRWPEFGTMCVAVMNVRSMVSIQLRAAQPERASLSFYSSQPNAFTDLDLGAASELASPLSRFTRWTPPMPSVSCLRRATACAAHSLA